MLNTYSSFDSYLIWYEEKKEQRQKEEWESKGERDEAAERANITTRTIYFHAIHFPNTRKCISSENASVVFFFWCRSHTHARCESSPLHWFRVNWIELPYFFVPSIFCCWHFLAKIHTHMARNWFQLCFLSLFHTLEQVWFCLWFRCFQHISLFFFVFIFTLSGRRCWFFLR